MTLIEATAAIEEIRTQMLQLVEMIVRLSDKHDQLAREIGAQPRPTEPPPIPLQASLPPEHPEFIKGLL